MFSFFQFFVQFAETPGPSGLKRTPAVRAPRRPPPKAPSKRRRARKVSYRRRVASFPEAELDLMNLTSSQLVEKLEYPSVEAMDHAAFRAEVREYYRKRGNPEKYGVEPNKPVRGFHHQQPCEFSNDEDSSSGEDSDSEIDAGFLSKYSKMSKGKLFGSVEAISPEPLDSVDANGASSGSMEAAIVANLDMIGQFDDDVAHVANIEGFDDDGDNAVANIEVFEDNAPAVNGVVEGDNMPTNMVGLADTSEHLTDDQSLVKMRHLGSQFFAFPGIFPTFAIAGGKYISCSFNPAAAKDTLDPYGLKMFYLHCGRTCVFSDPKSGTIPLTTSALRDLVANFGSFVAHARSKASLVTVPDIKTGKPRLTSPNPILDLKLGDRIKCPHSGNFGQVWAKFVHAQNGDPLCVIDFVHYRVACNPDGRRPAQHTNFVVQVQTIFHLVKNVFPLMNEFQKFVCEKAFDLVQRTDVVLPEVSDGRVIVNDVTINPNVTWEYGVLERADD